MTTPARFPPSRSWQSPKRARWTWALLVALLAVQTLGVLHRAAHVDLARLSAVAAIGYSAEAAEAPRSVRGWLGTLFAGHAGARDCDAFDQMSHGDAAVTITALDLGGSPPAMASAVVHPAWHLAAQARGFLARGPPATA